MEISVWYIIRWFICTFMIHIIYVCVFIWFTYAFKDLVIDILNGIILNDIFGCLDV